MDPVLLQCSAGPAKGSGFACAWSRGSRIGTLLGQRAHPRDGHNLQTTPMAKKLWPDNESTEQLLDAAREGDPSAVNHLLEQHRRPVRRLVEMRLDRRVQQRVDVSDVV